MATPKIYTVAKSAPTMAKALKTKKSIARSKKPNVSSESSHPPYIVMISDALGSLKERSGSSSYAISKFIEAKQSRLPSNFRKLLSVQLKRLVAIDKLVKVKNSFKLSVSKLKSVNLVKKSDAKQVTSSDKQIAKAGSKRKSHSSDKPAEIKKVAKTSTKRTPGKVPEVKKPVVTKMKKSSVAKVRKPKSIKSAGRKVQLKK